MRLISSCPHKAPSPASFPKKSFNFRLEQLKQNTLIPSLSRGLHTLQSSFRNTQGALAMWFTQWLNQMSEAFSPSRPCTVRAAQVSVTGTLHEADRIPNQDTSFTMHHPDIQHHEKDGRRPRSGGRSAPGVYAAGVFDGHGPQGHVASALAAEKMQSSLERLLNDAKPRNLNTIVKEAFEEVAMILNSAECSATSGSTGSIVVLRDDNIVFANVGDSTAMLICKPRWGRKKIIRYESPKHRPCSEKEASRILSSGGYIQNGYVVDEGAKNGIAVTRTLGDRDMQLYGCVSSPDIRQFKILPSDVCVLVASDGLWDVPDLDLQAVLRNVRAGIRMNPGQICRGILRLASRKTRPTDDCTIACLTLE